MKEGHLKVAHAVADILERAKNGVKDTDAEVRLKREKEAKDARLKEVIAAAKSSPEATVALKVSMADELHTAWYRDSFLAKLLGAKQIEPVSVKVLSWCNQTTRAANIPDEPRDLEELFVDLQNAVMYSDACLLQALANSVLTRQVDSKKLTADLVESLNTGLYQYALINSGTWHYLISDPVVHRTFTPVSKHELLLTGMLGTWDAHPGRSCTVYTDAFRHPQAKSFPISNVADVYLFQESLDPDTKIAFASSEDVTYGFDQKIPGLKATFADMKTTGIFRVQEKV